MKLSEFYVLIIFFRDGDQNIMLLMFTEKEKLRIEGIKIGRWNAYFIKKTANDNSNNFNNNVIASRSIYIMV